MNSKEANEKLRDYLKVLKWFKDEPRTLEQGKKFVFQGGFRFFNIRRHHQLYGKLYYRVRGLGPSEDECQIQTFSYPPKKYNQLGRANLKGKQVFYAAEDPVTAIYEYLNTGSEDNYIYISEWELSSNVSIPTFEIMESPGIQYFRDEMGNDFAYDNNLMNEMFRLIIELFNKSKRYEFTAPFCHFLLYLSDVCKMIRYPSVTTEARSKCVAINIDFFDLNFSIKKVYKVKVFGKIAPGELEGLDIPGVLFGEATVGDVVDNDIIYRDFNKSDEDFWNYYRLEQKEEGKYGFISDEK